MHLSDFHSEAFPRLEDIIPAVIADLRPDLIVFTGDAINCPEGLPVFKNCMSRLSRIAPLYGVDGNWDLWYWPELDRAAGTGMRKLENEVVRMTAAGNDLWIAGSPDCTSYDYPKLFEGIPKDACIIFIYHRPDEVRLIAATGRVALYCAGHTHGGQICLPGYGALVTLSLHGKAYESGLYREGTMALYINRGLGLEGGAAPRMRFWARPEVTLIELGPE